MSANPNANTIGVEGDSGAARWCSHMSRAVGEQLFGTATRVSAWFALEYDHTFGTEALPDSTLPDAVKAHLKAATKALPGSRAQLIRQPGRDAQSPGTRIFVVAVPGALYRFELPDVRALLALDLPAIADRAPRFDANRVSETLWLACVNGKRDRCCAKYGAPMYDALRREMGGAWVWQTAHLGGHRFAPTLAVLPDGLMYGRATVNVAGALVREQAARRIALDFYRGCTYDDEPVQAAEYYLRRETGILSIDGLLRRGALRGEDGLWRVQFEVIDPERLGLTYEVVIESAPSAFHIAKSCADTALAPVMQHRLVDVRPVG